MPPRMDVSASIFWGGTLCKEASMSLIPFPNPGILILAHYLYSDFRRRASRQLDFYGKFPERFERFLKNDIFPFNFNAFILERLFYILGSYRSEQFILLADAPGNSTGYFPQLLHYCLRLFSFLFRNLKDMSSFVFQNLHVFTACFDSKTLRYQIIPPIPSGYIHCITGFSQ